MSDEVARAARWVSFWDSVETWAFLAVVVALAIEFAAHKFVQAPREVVERAREAESAQLRKDTAEANAKALATELELARIKAPRVLAADKAPAFVEAMKPYAGQKFAGTVASGVPDAWPLWSAISAALMRSGWTCIEPLSFSFGNPPAGVPVSPNEGVTVFAPSAGAAKLAPIAKAVADALTIAGIAARPALTNAAQFPPDEIVVEVGTKPQ